MKIITKSMSVLTVLSILLFTLIPSFAVSNTRTIEYFEDGAYIVTEITENKITRATNTKSGSKTSKYYNSKNVLEWTVILNATFTYNGSTATCTSANNSYSIVNTAWKVTDAKSSRSGNTATGNFTVKRYALGIVTKTENRTLKLSCSANGTLS